jgi:hypothetical protein
VCVNEAFHSYGDCLLIWQATRRHGETPEARLAWLRRHSSCVLGPTDPAPTRTRIGNCRWSRYLVPGDAAPLNWPEGWVWEGINQRSWARTIQLTRGLVAGLRPRGGWPCALDPDTWAGRRTDEQRIAGLPPTIVPLNCTDPLNRERQTANEGFRVMSPEQRAEWDAQFVDVNDGADVDVD